MKRLAVNPYLPAWEYIPDGEPHVFDERVYIFGSHDSPNGKIYCEGDYVCWSAPVDDLADWHYEGVIYRRIDDPCNPDGEYRMFAPDVCRGTDGKFYLYYGLNNCTTIGVAVSDTPAGHYLFLGNIRLPDGRELKPGLNAGQPFDPAAYVENGRTWLYYGFGMDFSDLIPGPKGGFVAELESDMVTMKAWPKLICPGKNLSEGTEWEAHPFFEASSMRKIDGRYYFVYSSQQGHELCYGISSQPDEAPRFGGVIVSNGDVGLPGRETANKAVYYLGNNHGGLEQINGQVYIFYHRHTHGTQYSRQGCAEPVTILPDGSIPQVEITSSGLNCGPIPARGEHSAHIICALHGVEGPKQFSRRLQKNEADAWLAHEYDASPTSFNLYLENLQQGAAFGYKYFQFEGLEQMAAIEVRGSFVGEVFLHLDREDGPIAAGFTVTPSERWIASSESIHIEGIHAVYLTIVGKGILDFNSIRFW